MDSNKNLNFLRIFIKVLSSYELYGMIGNGIKDRNFLMAFKFRKMRILYILSIKKKINVRFFTILLYDWLVL